MRITPLPSPLPIECRNGEWGKIAASVRCGNLGDVNMADTALQRKNMVESQVRPSDVTDRRIMAAMADLPRERFVPENLKPLAYMDEALPLVAGRALLAPRILARLIQLCEIEAADTVLDVGSLTGYTAAIVARLGRKVLALDCDAGLAKASEAALQSLQCANVAVVTGPLSGGHAPGAPYDVILIEGAVEHIPEALTSQLAAGGRLVTIENLGGIGRAIVMGKNASGQLSYRAAFEASAGLLAGFERAKSFVF